MSDIAPSPESLAERIMRRDAGRDSRLLAIKYRKMDENLFVFLRGTCHLFYDALPDSPVLDEAPLAWACGDLHLENFGSYKGNERQICFDINDFDMAALAPCTWDLVRLLCSMLCCAETLGVVQANALEACRAALHAYRDALLKGTTMAVERETSSGLIFDLLDQLHKRRRVDFLNKHTERHGSKRRIRIDNLKAMAASDAQHAIVATFMQAFAAQQARPDFFQVLDVARRIAGTGSLGVERYLVLIEGKGSPDACYLIDLKQARPSSLDLPLRRRKLAHAEAADDASRVVDVQKRMQAVNQALLQAVMLGSTPFVLKELQPEEDRVDIAAWERKSKRLDEVAGTMGGILAWDQLRAAGQRGAAGADALKTFAEGRAWMDELLDAARTLRDITQKQWQAFKLARQERMLGNF
ncbi:MAG TPA: DUF2252 family protein [Thiobacillaceae bacterium]|nr:DUF2252 family protein [Thiobacillaceae bacterium]